MSLNMYKLSINNYVIGINLNKNVLIMTVIMQKLVFIQLITVINIEVCVLLIFNKHNLLKSYVMKY